MSVDVSAIFVIPFTNNSKARGFSVTQNGSWVLMSRRHLWSLLLTRNGQVTSKLQKNIMSADGVVAFTNIDELCFRHGWLITLIVYVKDIYFVNRRMMLGTGE